MRKVWILLECEHSADNPQIRIYLPGVRRKILLHKIQKACQKAISIGIKMLAAAALTSPFALWSVRSAYLARGYRACGGEWFLIIAVYLLCYKLLVILFDD